MLSKQISICGISFEIREVEKILLDTPLQICERVNDLAPAGYMDYENRIIKIRSGLPLPEKRLIFLHECLEAVFKILNKDIEFCFAGQKERAITRISEYIYKYWFLMQEAKKDITEAGIRVAIKEAEKFLNKKNRGEDYSFDEPLVKAITETAILGFRHFARLMGGR